MAWSACRVSFRLQPPGRPRGEETMLHDLFTSKGTHYNADHAWPLPNVYLHQMCPQHEE